MLNLGTEVPSEAVNEGGRRRGRRSSRLVRIAVASRIRVRAFAEVEVLDSEDGKEREGVRVDLIESVETDRSQFRERQEEIASSTETILRVIVEAKFDVGQRECSERRYIRIPIVEENGVKVESDETG